LTGQGEEVGTLPVHGGDGLHRGGSYSVEVGHQRGRIGGEQVERILEQVIEPTGGGWLLRRGEFTSPTEPRRQDRFTIVYNRTAKALPVYLRRTTP
jgi:hypothetical protein